MKKIAKCGEDADDASRFSHLPDEIILQILNKLIDLKTLCFCYLVSKRYSSIVLQVDVISLTTPVSSSPMADNSTFGDVSPSKLLHHPISSCHYQSLRSALTFLYKFRGVKSLCITERSSHIGNADRCLFKWRVKFGKRAESVFLLSPHSISDADGFHVDGKGDEEEDMDLRNQLLRQSLILALECVEDVASWRQILLYVIKNLPMLEEVSITDSGRRGRLSLTGGKLAEVKEWLHSDSEIEPTTAPVSLSLCYIPGLELPVSGYVMKGITLVVIDLQGGNGGLMISEDGFEDKEEAAYTEAVMEILKNHKSRMHRVI